MSANPPRIGVNLPVVADRFTAILRKEVERFDINDEREFLPAALEILETPPSPARRLMGISIGIFMLFALGWALFGKVDILATATGRILPVGRIKLIQPVSEGTVKQILVSDGDHVRAGQTLIELDPAVAGATQQSVSSDYVSAELDVERLTALKDHRGGASRLARPPGATDADVAQAQAALDAQADQQAAKLSGLDEQISEARAQVAEAQAEIGRLASTLPMLAEKERLHQKLRDEGFGTSFALLDAQQELSSARNEKTVDADKLAQARAALFALDQQRAEAVSEFQAGVLSDLAKAQEKASELSADLVKADKASTDTTLRAPIAGVVEELAVHTVGGVVTPAQRLAVIVPDNGALEVEAELPNRDVGFVHKGDDASVKVATFNFTRYGMLKGKVVDISRDAVGAQDKAAEDSSASPDAQARLPLGPPTFLATIALPQDYMLVDGKAARLVPGMSVTAEIKTGRRTIMNYLLSPLARRTDESLHER